MIVSYKTVVRADRFAELKSRIGPWAAGLVEVHTDGAIATMKQLAPVSQNPPPDHVHMRDTIEKVNVESNRSFGLKIGIRIGAPYWVFVNYGTVHMAARPFVEPALQTAYEGLMEDAANFERALA